MTTMTYTPTAIVLSCDVCQKPVTGRTGYLIATWRDIHKAEVQRAEWKRVNPGPTITGTALQTYPAPARWHIYHRDCDPTPDEGYFIDAYRTDDALQLLKWTAHLMGKDWLQHTDWDQLIRRLVADSGYSPRRHAWKGLVES